MSEKRWDTATADLSKSPAKIKRERNRILAQIKRNSHPFGRGTNESLRVKAARERKERAQLELELLRAQRAQRAELFNSDIFQTKIDDPRARARARGSSPSSSGNGGGGVLK